MLPDSRLESQQELSARHSAVTDSLRQQLDSCQFSTQLLKVGSVSEGSIRR